MGCRWSEVQILSPRPVKSKGSARSPFSIRHLLSMSSPFRAACLQLNSGNDPAANLATVKAMVAEAAKSGAQLVLTPEYTLLMDGSGRVMRDNALAPDGGATLVELQDLARTSKVWLLIGSLTLKTGAERIVHRSFLISDA